MANANDAKRRTTEAVSAPVREDGLHEVEATEEGRSDPPPALQEEAQDLGAVEQTTQENSAKKSGIEGESARWRESTLERAGEAQEARKPGRIGRVPGAPDSALTGSDPSSKTPLQLPTEVCERIIDWLWEYTWMLWRCALVCKAWTPRCRYQMQRHVALWDRSTVRGHARRARAQPHLLLQARSVWVEGGAKGGERALGTFAIMAAAKLQLAWRLDIARAIWKPSDFHPLIFVHLSAFSSLTTLELYDVTFPKVREFGRLVCALPSLVRLRCENVLFSSTAPCAGLATTRCPPRVRLTDLVIFSTNETASNVEANVALIGHLCAAGVVADLQKFEFHAEASSDSKYLGAYREPLHELFRQCSQSLLNVKLSPESHAGNVRTDVISDMIIGHVFDLAQCNLLEIVALKALNFERVGYAWMRRILESNVSKNLSQVSIIVDQPYYNQNVRKNLQMTVFALRKDMCPQFNELFSNKKYEKLHHVDFVFRTRPDRPIPDETRWSTLLKAAMPKLDERGVLRTRVDVHLRLFNEDDF